MIKTQRVEVEFENPKDVFELRDHLSEVCRYRLIPAIEKLFDEKSTSNSILSITSLHIDAGKLPVNDWESAFVEAVIKQLRDYLTNALSEENNTGAQHQPASSGKSLNSLLYYLKNGLQPWNTPFESKESLKNELLGLIKADNDVVENLRDLIISSPKALKRLVYLIPEKYIVPILRKKGWKSGEIRKIRKDWEVIFKFIKLPETEYGIVFLSALSAVYNSSTLSGNLAEALSREIVQLLKQRYQPAFSKLSEVPAEYFTVLPKDRIVRFSEEKAVKTPKEENSKIAIEEPVYILNAGLVILHPFLGNLFGNVGYTDKDNWTSEQLHQRSVLLTQYLINGTDDYAEYDLYLNKVLTGFPADEPLPVDILLSDFEKAEAGDLLQSVIDHWQALKNTSIPGFQNTFLQRSGKIEKKDTGRLLQVDQQGPDILLDKIPWGFSTIKTPWMEELLSVEWT